MALLAGRVCLQSRVDDAEELDRLGASSGVLGGAVFEAADAQLVVVETAVVAGQFCDSDPDGGRPSPGLGRWLGND